MTTYRWPTFYLNHEPETGQTFTFYRDDIWSGCGVVPEDHEHAAALGITPAQHRLVHELGHHLVGLHYYADPNGSPIVYRDAHNIPQEAGGMVKPDWSEADREEWMTTALTYMAYTGPKSGMRVHYKPAEYDVWAIKELESCGADPWGLARRLRWLMDAATEGVREVVLPGITPNQKAA